jgi:hypothetical protein
LIMTTCQIVILKAQENAIVKIVRGLLAKFVATFNVGTFDVLLHIYIYNKGL